MVNFCIEKAVLDFFWGGIAFCLWCEKNFCAQIKEMI